MAALPKHAPVRQQRAETGYSRRVLGVREARRLAELLAVAERRGLAVLEAAKREADSIFAEARAEANAILAMMPNLDALEATPTKRGKTALAVIRRIADARGLAFAVVAGRLNHERAVEARAAAVAAVVRECPNLTRDEVGALFAGRSAAWVGDMLKQARDL